MRRLREVSRNLAATICGISSAIQSGVPESTIHSNQTNSKTVLGVPGTLSLQLRTLQSINSESEFQFNDH